ncbi:C1 family peptidase [Microbacterium sp. DT81.1]|uniref:C1 family peptidase n=1 Tax=Microbacterium sp. DT81.1 TaxID=3393413 RepID=UPI003CF6DBC3
MIAVPNNLALQPLAEFTRGIDDALQLALRNQWVTEVPLAVLLGEEVSLASDQTPIRSQQDRGSCWAFAGIAALEAAYKRLHGLTLDLSEQYLFHICKAHESDFGNHSLMGFQGSSDIVKHMERMRVPEEGDAPYMTQANMIATIPGAAALNTAPSPSQEQRDDFEFSPVHIPFVARGNAKYGVASSGVLSNFSIADLENVIRAKHEVVVNVTVSGGGHVLLLVGFNSTQRYFLAKNSWGEGGLIRIKYENDPQFSINTGIAHYIIDVIDPAVDRRAAFVGQWDMDHDGWRGRLTLRRFTDLRAATDTFSPGDATKLGSYYLDGGKHDVTGWFADAGQTAHLRIADIGGGGQDFTLSVYSNDVHLAAGDTSWAGIPFGAQIRRTPIEGAPADPFDRVDWLGTWEMNHDGWRGALVIDGIDPASGGAALSYRRSTGEVRPAFGGVRSDHPHVMDFTIDFGPDNSAQTFTLQHHTRERGIASGFTTWAGRRFGAIAKKTADKPAWRGFEIAPVGSGSAIPNIAAVSRIPNSMETWWVGPSGSIEAGFWYDGGQWTRYQLAPAGAAAPASGIAVVSRIPNSMELWWIGPSGSIEAAFWYEGGAWTRYQVAPDGSADVSSGITAVSRVPNSMELWWAGPDGSVEAAFWYEGGQWSRYQLSPAGSAGRGSEFSAVSRVPNSMELWWTGPAGSVEAAFWYEGGQWGRYQLSGPGSAAVGGGIAAVSRIPNSMELWWTGASGSIEAAFWYEGGQWTRYQVAPDGSALPSSGVAAVSRKPETMELWFAGADQSVQGAFWYEGGSWTRYGLEGPQQAGNPFAVAAVSRVPGSMELWWSGSGGSVRDSFFYEL